MKQLTKEEVLKMKKDDLREVKEKIDLLCDEELKKFSKKMKTILKKEKLLDVMDANISFRWVLKE